MISVVATGPRNPPIVKRWYVAPAGNSVVSVPVPSVPVVSVPVPWVPVVSVPVVSVTVVSVSSPSSRR